MQNSETYKRININNKTSVKAAYRPEGIYTVTVESYYNDVATNEQVVVSKPEAANIDDAIIIGMELLRQKAESNAAKWTGISRQLRLYLDTNRPKTDIASLSDADLNRLYELIELVRKDMVTGSDAHMPKFVKQENADRYLLEHLNLRRRDIEAIYKDKPNPIDPDILPESEAPNENA